MRFGYFFVLSAFFLASCGEVDFVYNNEKNLTNPLYNKSSIKLMGGEVPSFYKYSSKYFGVSKESVYEIRVNIQEIKSKRAVKNNQAISKEDYELVFDYEIFNFSKKCNTYKKNIVSRFSYEPKASGYNFGSDQSLQNLYDLATKDNFQRFINFVSETDASTCLDEN